MKVHYTKSEHQGSSYVGTVSPDQQQLSRQRLLITFHLRTFNYRCGRLNLGPPAQTLSMALLHLYWEREWEEGTGGGGGGERVWPRRALSQFTLLQRKCTSHSELHYYCSFRNQLTHLQPLLEMHFLVSSLCISSRAAPCDMQRALKQRFARASSR